MVTYPTCIIGIRIRTALTVDYLTGKRVTLGILYDCNYKTIMIQYCSYIRGVEVGYPLCSYIRIPLELPIYEQSSPGYYKSHNEKGDMS